MSTNIQERPQRERRRKRRFPRECKHRPNPARDKYRPLRR